MIIKDLNPKDAALSGKKRCFIEISWTCYFHLHLGQIIRANLKKSQSPVNHVNHVDYFFSFTQFPRCNSRPVVSREQQYFQDDVFFLMAPLESKNGVEKPHSGEPHAGLKKLNVERFDRVKMMIPVV